MIQRLIWRLRWRLAAAKITPPVEYCCIQSAVPAVRDGTRDEKYPVVGWIPRPVFESITGQVFRRGEMQWIRRECSERIMRHPLFVTDKGFSE